MPKFVPPNFIVHYSRGEPFRSITSFPQDQWQNLVEKLNSSNAWGLNRFADPEYLKQRVLVETEMRKAFIVKGGKPQLQQPIYFFLGANKRFEENKLNKGYKINLDEIESKHVSFTYGDSILAFVKENRDQSGPLYMNPLCEEVYRLGDLETVYSSIQFPSENQLAFEAQLWIPPPARFIQTLSFEKLTK